MDKEQLLQKIKDEVAKERGCADFNDYNISTVGNGEYVKEELSTFINFIATRYAIAMCEEQIKLCGEQTDGFQKPLVLKTTNVAE